MAKAQKSEQEYAIDHYILELAKRVKKNRVAYLGFDVLENISLSTIYQSEIDRSQDVIVLLTILRKLIRDVATISSTLELFSESVRTQESRLMEKSA